MAAAQIDHSEFWQRLLAAELPPAKSRAILQSLGSVRDPNAIRDHPALTIAERQRIDEHDPSALRAAMARGVRAVLPAEYPEILHQLAAEPPALFAWGDFATARSPMVAVVGTRAASPYGRAAATKFAEALARAGVTVVSGGAMGIDAAAHRGALDAGGNTIVVLAGGVDKLYPAVNRGLFERIRGAGCLVSQFAVGSKPNAYKFLTRNGLIAALTQAVLVVEAPARSGSLRTAHVANDLGRQVFVMPATIDMLSFAGSHSLIRDGATLVDHPDQVLEAIGIAAVSQAISQVATSNIGERILAELSVHPLSPERIAERTGMQAQEVLSELTMLELEGHAVRTDGGYTKSL